MTPTTGTSAHALLTFERIVRTPQEAAVLVASGCGCEDQVHCDPQTFSLLDPGAPESSVTWTGVIGFEGQLTGDGRYIEPNALTWDTLPIPIRWAPKDEGGHDGAQVVGRILTVTRGAGGSITATGDFDMGSPIGYQAARQVDEGLTTGISMDLDSAAFEIRVSKDLLNAAMPGDDMSREMQVADPTNTHVTVVTVSPDDEIMSMTSARIRAATMVAIPAFEGARINLSAVLPAQDADGDGDGDVAETQWPELASVSTLVAGAFAVAPPLDFFKAPSFNGPTPLSISKDGRVYGHLAAWGSCHTAYSGQCVEPPHSPTSYAYFRTGSVLCKDGSEVAVGQITLDTGHAGASMGAKSAMSHYDNTGSAVADVTVGEDIYGIWVAGAMRPNASAEQVRALRASPLSGDWRRIGGNLELIAALAVNSPGFPIPRPQGLVASGVMQTLVASGMIAPDQVLPPGTEGAFSIEELRYLKTLASRERKTQADAMAASLTENRVRALASQLV